MKKKLAVDIDGVIMDYHGYITKKGRDYFRCVPIDPSGESVCQIFSVSEENHLEFWKDNMEDYYTNGDLLIENVALLRRVAEDFDLIFVTKRGGDWWDTDILGVSRIKELTIQTLNNSQIPYVKLLMSVNDKSAACKEYGCCALIDDSIYHCESVVAPTVPILMGHIYNKTSGLGRVHRVANTSELSQILSDLLKEE